MRSQDIDNLPGQWGPLIKSLNGIEFCGFCQKFQLDRRLSVEYQKDFS
jgi:hypothetical protein